MLFSLRAIGFAASLAASVTGFSQPHAHKRDFSESDTYNRDVLVIGGGASGTYGAIKLLDNNKTVMVVERDAVTGGNTNTYHDPATGTTLDFGVVIYGNTSLTKTWFKRFNVSVGASKFSPTNMKTVDFTTGLEVTNFTSPDPTEALKTYKNIILQYPYLDTGFDLPDPVPEDLLIPFGTFLQKHNITEIAYLFFNYAQGLGNLMDQPAIYVIKNMGRQVIQDIDTGFLATTKNDNGEIYRLSASLLQSKDSLFLSSTVASLSRSSTGIRAVITTPDGLKLVNAKQLLVSSPPKPSSLQGFDLTSTEMDLFSQFNNSAYWTGLVRHTSLPENYTINNALPTSFAQIPLTPSSYSFYSSSIPGLYNVKYGSPYLISDSLVKSNIRAELVRMGQSGVMPGAGDMELNWIEFNAHIPFLLTVSPEKIRGGFYRDLYALQGTMDTWWTGAAWHTQDSSLVWNYTEAVVQRMLMV